MPLFGFSRNDIDSRLFVIIQDANEIVIDKEKWTPDLDLSFKTLKKESIKAEIIGNNYTSMEFGKLAQIELYANNKLTQLFRSTSIKPNI